MFIRVIDGIEQIGKCFKLNFALSSNFVMVNCDWNGKKHVTLCIIITYSNLVMYSDSKQKRATEM